MLILKFTFLMGSELTLAYQGNDHKDIVDNSIISTSDATVLRKAIFLLEIIRRELKI